MNIRIVGREKAAVKQLAQQVKDAGHTLSKKPDIIISLGGDGTLLYAERNYPGIPKIPVRGKSICKKCSEQEIIDLLEQVAQGRAKKIRYKKVEATITKRGKQQVRVALNDVVIRNKNPFEALRFLFNGEKYIGDGIVASTVFGSSGYFQSITRKTFKEGIGLAFNNNVTPTEPLIGKNIEGMVMVLRSKAQVAIDNDPKTITLQKGDTIHLKESEQSATLITPSD